MAIMSNNLLYPYQAKDHLIMAESNVLLAYEMGLGKALELSTKVLTPSGWRTASDINVGDFLIGRDGSPTEVLGVYPQPPGRELLNVTFVDGASVVVDADHLWSVQRPADTHRDPERWIARTTADLQHDLYDAAGNRKWRIPMLTEPVQFAPVTLHDDPYLLGVVLGDGTWRSTGTWEVDTDLEILEAIKARGIRAQPGCYRGHVTLVHPKQRSWEKEVPPEYLRGTSDQRLALLQGLLDTDGYPMPDGGIEFTSASESLVDAVVDLVRGLGGVARNKTSRIPKYTHKGKSLRGRESWRVNLKLPTNMVPFRLYRKRTAWTPTTKYAPVMPIVDIQPIGTGDAVCFQVAAPDHLFLIEGYKVTHNTPTTLVTLDELRRRGDIEGPGIIVVPASLKWQWEREVRRWTTGEPIVIDGTPSQRLVQYGLATDCDYVIMTYDAFVRDWSLHKHIRAFLVLDECFPDGALVDTPNGPRPIQDISVGDVVLGARGPSVVRRTMSRFTESLVRVTFEDGSEVVCTPNHQFFTAVGWQEARLLGHGTKIVKTNEAMRLVRNGYADTQGVQEPTWVSRTDREILRNILLGEVEDVSAGNQGKVIYRRSPTEARREEPYVARVSDARGTLRASSPGASRMDRRVRRAVPHYLDGQRKYDQGSSGQRTSSNPIGEGSAEPTRGGLAVELRNLPRTKEAWVSDELQGGPGPSRTSVSGGGGRELSSITQGTRREEGLSPAFLRVDRVEVLQSGDSDFDRLSGEENRVRVHNLEVQGHPSYSVNRLLVHNCTAIKNYKSKRSMHLKKVRDRYPIRFALTGTPIENGNPEELFSILEWVDPNILGKYWPFEQRYIIRNTLGWIEGYRNLGDFHSRIKPYVLRRTHKEPEVAKYLPKVRHLDPYIVEMDRATETIYNKIAGDILSDLDEMVMNVHGAANRDSLEDRHPDGKMMGKIQTARMFLDHPDVVSEADGDYATSIARTHLVPIMRSPKLEAAISYVNDFLDASEKNKVVIFTSFIHMAKLLEICWGGMSVKFTGLMSARHRDEAKIEFQTNPSVRVFVSTDAGGYGLDLPQANLLVNYDQPWQAGLLKQRNARIRRASSEWDYVVVQDFVVGGTLEERMLDMLAHKMAVSDAIIDGEGITEDGNLISDLDSLRSFLGKSSEREPIRAS